MTGTETATLEAVFLAFTATLLGVPLARWFALRVGILAVPSGERSDRRPMPEAGGIAIIAALIAACAAVGYLAAWKALGLAGLFALGLIDDIVVLKPWQKLVPQVVITAAAVAIGPHFMLTPWLWADAVLTVGWLVATTNAFNLIDGLDGLAAGTGVVIGIGMAAIGMLHGDARLICQAFALSAALGGFLAYNTNPASIIMGDGGALPVGFFFGALALEAGGLSESSRLTRYAIPILLMAVPLLDTVIVSVTRAATDRSITLHGRDHSHHRLLALGLSEWRAVVVVWVVAALGSACAIALSAMTRPYIIMTLPAMALIFAVIGLFMMDLTFDARPPGDAYTNVRSLARLILNVGYKRRIVEAVLDLGIIATAYFAAFLIRNEFRATPAMAREAVRSLPWLAAVTYAAFLTVGIYREVWRHAGLSDAIRFGTGASLAGVLAIVAGRAGVISMSGSVAVLFVIFLFNLLGATRLSFTLLRRAIGLLALAHRRVLVVGAGRAGEEAVRHLFLLRNADLKVVGFVDNDNFKQRKWVHGHPVLGTLDELEQLHQTYAFNEIVVAEDHADGERLAQVTALANRFGIQVSRFFVQMEVVGKPSAAAGG